MRQKPYSISAAGNSGSYNIQGADKTAGVIDRYSRTKHMPTYLFSDSGVQLRWGTGPHVGRIRPVANKNALYFTRRQAANTAERIS